MLRSTSVAAIAFALSACAFTPQAPGPEEIVDAPPVNRFADLDPEAFAEPDESVAVVNDPLYDVLRRTTLTRFSSEEEFLSWAGVMSKASEGRSYGWYQPMPVPVMAAPMEDAAAESSTIVVTGAKASTTASDANPEITNNQIRGVDEGDIVKQIGNRLVVLQDGRLFVVSLDPGTGDRLSLESRVNVYRSADEDTWYDEMLVAGRTILVTGYSYRENASEFTVLTLNEDGSITRNNTFYISSDDYYDTENYATRMIDGKLVIHTPIFMAGMGWWDRFDPPRIREWRAEGAEGEREDAGEPLFNAQDIWMPVQRTVAPVIHTVTVCDIGGAVEAGEPRCHATAMVGSENYEFLVTADAFWLWMSPSMADTAVVFEDYDAEDALEEACEAGERAPDDKVMPSVLVQLPIDGSQPRVAGVKGKPQNQFSMDLGQEEFRALLDWQDSRCPEWVDREDSALTFFDMPLGRLSPTLADVSGTSYTRLPSPGAPYYEARFADTHLVYGGRDDWDNYPPDPDTEATEVMTAQAIVVPVADPSRPVRVRLPHGVIRTERAGPYMALTGYRDAKGLSVSLIDLRDVPKRVSTIVLGDRYESENRSHAFNSAIGADGSGLIGVPTVVNEAEAGRWWWWSDTSDLTFLSVEKSGKLGLAGTLPASEEGDSDYDCEVSCVDWYGNARPIFTGGRVLALINTEIVEGVYENGRVREIARVDLTKVTGGDAVN